MAERGVVIRPAEFSTLNVLDNFDPLAGECYRDRPSAVVIVLPVIRIERNPNEDHADG